MWRVQNNFWPHPQLYWHSNWRGRAYVALFWLPYTLVLSLSRLLLSHTAVSLFHSGARHLRSCPSKGLVSLLLHVSPFNLVSYICRLPPFLFLLLLSWSSYFSSSSLSPAGSIEPIPLRSVTVSSLQIGFLFRLTSNQVDSVTLHLLTVFFYFLSSVLYIYVFPPTLTSLVFSVCRLLFQLIIISLLVLNSASCSLYSLVFCVNIGFCFSLWFLAFLIVWFFYLSFHRFPLSLTSSSLCFVLSYFIFLTFWGSHFLPFAIPLSLCTSPSFCTLSPAFLSSSGRDLLLENPDPS